MKCRNSIMPSKQISSPRALASNPRRSNEEGDFIFALVKDN